MALIKCKECGQMVSDKAGNCLHCGAPIEKSIACEECGKEMPESSTVCPNCGCPNPSFASQQYVGAQNRSAQAQGTPYRQAPVVNYPNAKQGGKANVAICLVLGIIAYGILTTIICNLIRQNSYHYYYDFEAIIRDMRNEIMICAAVAAVISAIVAKSMVDRLEGIVAIAIGAFACCAEDGDSVGIAIAPHVVNVAVIIFCSVRRKRYFTA